MRLKVSKMWSFLLALAFLVAWLPGLAKAVYVQEWEDPVQTSTKAGDNGVTCKSGENVFVAWVGPDAIYAQLVSPSGEKLWGDDGKKIMTRGTGAGELAAVCLPDGRFFVAARDGDQIYYQLVSASGAPQWGLDIDHLFGYEALDPADAEDSLSAVALSSSTVAVGYKDTDNAGKVFFVNLADGQPLVMPSCNNASTCTVIDSVDAGMQLVPMASDRVWAVADASKVVANLIRTDGQRSGEQVLDDSVDPTAFYAFSDGNSGVIVAYTNTNTTKVAVIRSNLTTIKDATITDADLYGAAMTSDGYLALATDAGLNKYRVDDARLGQNVWQNPMDLSCAASGCANFAMAGLADGAIGYSWINGGKLYVQVVQVVDGAPTNLLGDGYEVDGADENVAMLPGSAYVVYGNDGTYYVYKFGYSALFDVEIVLNVSNVEISTAEDKELNLDDDDNITNVGEKGANDVSLRFYLVCKKLTDTSKKDDLLKAFEEAKCKTLVHEATFDIKAGETLNIQDNILVTDKVVISKEEANEFLKCCDDCDNATLVAIVNEGEAVDEANYDDKNLKAQSVFSITAPELTIGLQVITSTDYDTPSDYPFVEKETQLGGTIHIKPGVVKVTNTGKAAAEDVKVAFNLVCPLSCGLEGTPCAGTSNEPTPVVLPLGEKTIDQIAAGDSYVFDEELEFNVPESGITAEHSCCFLQVQVDPDNEIGECEDRNDCDSEEVNTVKIFNCEYECCDDLGWSCYTDSCLDTDYSNDNEAASGCVYCCYSSAYSAGKVVTVHNPNYVEPKPDLTVLKAKARYVGGELAIQLVVQNIGEAAAGQFDIAFYASQDGSTYTPADYLYGISRDNGLDVLEKEIVNVKFMVDEQPAYVIIVVDDLEVVEESNEENNELAVEVLGGPICSGDHLDLCETEEECTSVGGYWCDGTCQAEPCPTCDADHLDLCTDEASCTSVGGYWCDGTCQAEPCPTNLPVWSIQCVDNAGMAQVLVSVSDCGNLCGQPVAVKIVATDPYDLTIDYSYVLWSGWVAGEESFVLDELAVVGPVDLLTGYSVTSSSVSGWYVGFYLDVNGDGQFDASELVYDQCP